MMKFERAILIAFFGNYLINNVVAACVALLPSNPGGGIFTVQYLTFVVLSAVVVGVLSWWLLGDRADLRSGATFGVIGFLVAIVTAFISGISGVVLQSGSLSQAMSVIPNFWPFLANWSTLVLLGYWVIPAAAWGYYVTWKGGGGMGMHGGSHDMGGSM
jgi:hypothetical protein